MSHVAFSVRDKTDVLPSMRAIAVLCAGEILAFTNEDEFGHTYGHVRNRSNDRVIELVFEDALEVSLKRAESVM